MTNCSLDEDSIEYIYCYYEFPDNYGGKSLNLKFDNKDTDYTIFIFAQEEFSFIEKLYFKNYFVNSSEQDVYFEVNSFYKIDTHSFKLVPEMSTNENITLLKCTYFNYGKFYAKCSGILNKVEAYYVYVDNKNTNLKLLVYPVSKEITRIHDIQPDSLYISSSATTLTLEVDYVVNLNKTDFTLVDEYDDNNKINLTKCSKDEKKSFLKNDNDYITWRRNNRKCRLLLCLFKWNKSVRRY